MTITSTVSAFLGKKKKSDDATFGESLDLGQIAISGDELQLAALADDEQPSVAVDTEEKHTSILDLDFMAAPLAELEVINKNQVSAPPIALNSTAENKTHSNTVSGAAPSAAPESTLSHQEHLLAAPTMVPMVAASSSLANTALAQTMRSDNETGFMIFGPDGALIESTDNFDKIVGMSDADRASISSYLDMLRYMSGQADLGTKDVEALSQKEFEKMRVQISKGITKTYKWQTTMLSGKTLAFTNKYTKNSHLVSLVSDITEQKEKYRILHAGLELGTAGYWSYSFTTGKSTLSDYIINKLSPAELSSVESKGIISIIHPEDAGRVQADFDKAIADKTRMDCEFRMVLEHGKEAIMRMIGEVEYSSSSGEADVFIAFLNDLTKDRQRTKELNEMKQISKNKSEFLARMSHEIRTPLNAIVGMTDALRDEVDNDEARETASFIADAAANLNTILSQTLEHERLSTSDIVLEEGNFNLSEIVRSTAAMWKKPCVDKGLTLNVRISPNLPESIKIDGSRFRQCLTNMISNAVKFTESGSVIVAVAAMSLETDQPKILIAVKDTGIGMDAEAAQNIFKPFQQGNATIQRRFGGSGLGMSITKHIVDAMNGHVKVKSAEGEGTTIAITLPLQLTNAVVEKSEPNLLKLDALANINKLDLPAQEAEARASSAALEKLPIETFHPHQALEPAASAKNIEPVVATPNDTEIRKNVAIIPSDYSGFDVLVVEDNPINQAVVRKLLTSHIRSMDFAFHGEEAIEILETKTFDVILMDIHMPVKDGIETTIEIRGSGKPWADTVIVALTADPDYQQKRVCRNIGMNDALSKPVKRQELLDVMQRVLNDRLLLSSAKQTA